MDTIDGKGLVEKFGLYANEIESIGIQGFYEGNHDFVITDLKSTLELLTDASIGAELKFLLRKRLIISLRNLYSQCYRYANEGVDATATKLMIVILSLTITFFPDQCDDTWEDLTGTYRNVIEDIEQYIVSGEWREFNFMKEYIDRIYRSIIECKTAYIWFKKKYGRYGVIDVGTALLGRAVDRNSKDHKVEDWLMQIGLLGDVISGRISPGEDEIVTKIEIEDSFASAIDLLGSNEMFNIIVPQKIFLFLEDLIASKYCDVIDCHKMEKMIYLTISHVVNEDRFIMKNARTFFKNLSKKLCVISVDMMKKKHITDELKNIDCVCDLVVCIILDNIKHTIFNTTYSSNCDISVAIFQLCDEFSYMINLLNASHKNDPKFEEFAEEVLYYLLLLCSFIYDISKPSTPPLESNRYHKMNTSMYILIDRIKKNNFIKDDLKFYSIIAKMFENLRGILQFLRIDKLQTLLDFIDIFTLKPSFNPEPSIHNKFIPILNMVQFNTSDTISCVNALLDSKKKLLFESQYEQSVLVLASLLTRLMECNIETVTDDHSLNFMMKLIRNILESLMFSSKHNYNILLEHISLYARCNQMKPLIDNSLDTYLCLEILSYDESDAAPSYSLDIICAPLVRLTILAEKTFSIPQNDADFHVCSILILFRFVKALKLAITNGHICDMNDSLKLISKFINTPNLAPFLFSHVISFDYLLFRENSLITSTVNLCNVNKLLCNNGPLIDPAISPDNFIPYTTYYLNFIATIINDILSSKQKSELYMLVFRFLLDLFSDCLKLLLKDTINRNDPLDVYNLICFLFLTKFDLVFLDNLNYYLENSECPGSFFNIYKPDIPLIKTHIDTLLNRNSITILNISLNTHGNEKNILGKFLIFLTKASPLVSSLVSKLDFSGNRVLNKYNNDRIHRELQTRINYVRTYNNSNRSKGGYYECVEC